MCETKIAAIAAAQKQLGRKKIGTRKWKTISEEHL